MHNDELAGFGLVRPLPLTHRERWALEGTKPSLSGQDVHFQTAKARCHEICPRCLPAVHAKKSLTLGYIGSDVSNGAREEMRVSKRSQKTLSRILGTVTRVQLGSKMGGSTAASIQT